MLSAVGRRTTCPLTPGAQPASANLQLPGMERSKLVNEIVGARDKLVDCGVPKVRLVTACVLVGGSQPARASSALVYSPIPSQPPPWNPSHAPCAVLSLQEDVVGLRTPYLDTDTAVREVLHQNGFLYEAALIEDW